MAEERGVRRDGEPDPLITRRVETHFTVSISVRASPRRIVNLLLRSCRIPSCVSHQHVRLGRKDDGP